MESNQTTLKHGDNRQNTHTPVHYSSGLDNWNNHNSSGRLACVHNIPGTAALLSVSLSFIFLNSKSVHACSVHACPSYLNSPGLDRLSLKSQSRRMTKISRVSSVPRQTNIYTAVKTKYFVQVLFTWYVASYQVLGMIV